MAYEDYNDFAFEERDNPRTSYHHDYDNEDEVNAKIDPVKAKNEPSGLELDEYYNWLEKLMNRAAFIDRLWWALRNVDTHIGERFLQSHGIIVHADGWEKLERLKSKQRKEIAKFNEVFYKDGKGYLVKKLTYRWLDEHCRKRHQNFMKKKRAEGVFYGFYDLDYAVKK